MSKKGQVTMFIIMGIIILMISAIYFYYSKPSTEPIISSSAPLLSLEGYKASVKSQVEYCLEASTQRSMEYVGLQGGYYLPPERYQYQFGAFIPYYYYDNKSQLPDLAELELQLGKAIKVFLPDCLGKVYLIYSDRGVMMNTKIEEVKVQLTDARTVIEATLPTTIAFKGQNTSEAEDKTLVNLDKLSGQTSLTELRNFEVVTNIKYKKVYDLAKEVVQLQAQYPQGLPLKGITEVAIKNNVSYKIIPAKTTVSEGEVWDEPSQPYTPDDRNSVIFALVDNQLFSKPYYFTFGLEYGINYDQKFAQEKALELKVQQAKEKINT